MSRFVQILQDEPTAKKTLRAEESHFNRKIEANTVGHINDRNFIFIALKIQTDSMRLRILIRGNHYLAIKIPKKIPEI